MVFAGLDSPTQNTLHCCNGVSKDKKDDGSAICSMRLSSIADDGQCAIDIKVDPNSMQHDLSNDLEITNAAGAVRRYCIGTRLPNTGGVVKQLGTYFMLCLTTTRRRSPYFALHSWLRRVAQHFLYTNLGAQYRSLSVGISHYFPSVNCYYDLRSPPPSYDSCKEVIDTMQWSETSVRFGYPWQVSLYRYTPLHRIPQQQLQ